MKHLFIILLISLFSCICYSQISPKAVMVKEAHIALNGTLNGAMGGNSRSIIEVALPPNTIEWYYTFTTARNKQSDNRLNTAIELTTKVASLLASSYTAGASVKFEGLAENAIKSLVIPHGAIPINTYVIDGNNSQLFLNGQQFNSYIVGNNTQSVSGSSLIKLNQYSPRLFYIALYNPNVTSGVLIDLEITATVLENENANSFLFNRINLVGKWKDENSTITMQEDGKVTIIWDNQSSANGIWKLDKDQLIFQFYKKNGTLSEPDPYTLITANGVLFKYKHQKSGTVYTSMKML